MSARDQRSERIEALHASNAVDLLNYFVRRIDPRTDAADLVAETFVVAWRRADAVPPTDEQGRMWLFGVARRVLANWQRGRRRGHALASQLRDDLRTESDTTSRAGDVLDVQRAVRGLPQGQREVIMLVHWDGFSLVESARILGIREPTARGRYARAKESLKQTLGDDPESGRRPGARGSGYAVADSSVG